MSDREANAWLQRKLGKVLIHHLEDGAEVTVRLPNGDSRSAVSDDKSEHAIREAVISATNDLREFCEEKVA